MTEVPAPKPTAALPAYVKGRISSHARHPKHVTGQAFAIRRTEPVRRPHCPTRRATTGTNARGLTPARQALVSVRTPWRVGRPRHVTARVFAIKRAAAAASPCSAMAPPATTGMPVPGPTLARPERAKVRIRWSALYPTNVTSPARATAAPAPAPTPQRRPEPVVTTKGAAREVIPVTTGRAPDRP